MNVRLKVAIWGIAAMTSWLLVIGAAALIGLFFFNPLP